MIAKTEGISDLKNRTEDGSLGNAALSEPERNFPADNEWNPNLLGVARYRRFSGRSARG